jgi:hypothetical protein
MMSRPLFTRPLVWIFCTSTLLVLTACNNKTATNPTLPVPSAPPPAPVESQAPSPQQSSQQSSQQSPQQSPQQEDNAKNFVELKQVVAQTRTAVESKNFDQAKQQFSEFETYWAKVEDGVKAKSKSNYKAIEEATDNINNGLRAKQPNEKQILADLESLSEVLKKSS